MEAAIISRSEVVSAMLQSGGLSLCWLHKEQGKSEEPKQNKMLPVAAIPIWALTVKVCNVCTYVCIDVCRYVRIYVCTYVCMYARMYECVRGCVCT